MVHKSFRRWGVAKLRRREALGLGLKPWKANHPALQRFHKIPEFPLSLQSTTISANHPFRFFFNLIHYALSCIFNPSRGQHPCGSSVLEWAWHRVRLVLWRGQEFPNIFISIEDVLGNTPTGVLVPLKNIVALPDFEWAARKFLNTTAYTYYRNGAAGEWSYRNNLEVFSRYRLRPRTFVDITNIEATLP